MQFTFPKQLKECFDHVHQIKNFIQDSLVHEDLDPYCRFKFRAVQDKYIYCLCNDCPSRIVFKKEEGRYVLLKARLNHQHRRIGAKRQHILDTIREYPACFNTQTIKGMAMSRFQISAATFYRYLRMSRSFGNTIEDVLTTLEGQGIFGVKINSSGGGQFPEILLLTSQAMIRKFQENRMIVKFDLTYNLVRERPSGEKQYSVGVFITQNNRMNIEPVAFVLMEDESKESFIKLFSEFFYLMKAPPQIIITDQQKAMKFALQQLNKRGLFQGEHLLDIFHVLRNAKKGLFNKLHINLLVALSRSCNNREYIRRRRVCLRNINGRDQQIFSIFQDKLEKCCIARLQPMFLGLSCSTNSVEKVNDIIKSKIPYSQNYLAVVGQLSKILMGIINKRREPSLEKIKVEHFSVVQEVRELRFQLCKQVFRKLMMELSLSSTCLVNASDNPNIYEIQEDDFDDDESFTVELNKRDGLWMCQCELTKKIGIPCAHIIKILLLRKQKLISAIDPWWIISEAHHAHSTHQIMQMPRKTRRHR